jgi:CDP-glycerol glycerophosphotransferase (TagB/SpsB family)
MEKWVGLPDVFVTSTCGDGGLGRNLIPHFRELAIPTVAVTDYWGGGQNQFFKEVEFWPDAICVQDELSKDMLLEDWHGYSETRVHVTGQPAFDALANMDAVKIKSEVRELSGCKDNRPLIVYAGQLQGSSETLLALVRALNTLPDTMYLTLLKHPRFFINSPEEEEPWNKAVAEFKNGVIFERGDFSTDEWSAACDVMISMTSTVLATAGYFRKECISILLPELDKLQGLGLSGLPMEKLGTCAVARSQNEIKTLIAKALSSNGLGLKENQEKHFKLDGKSASRVADVVEGLL